MDVAIDRNLFRVIYPEVPNQATSAAEHVELHRLFVVAVFPELTEKALGIDLRGLRQRLQIAFIDSGGPGPNDTLDHEIIHLRAVVTIGQGDSHGNGTVFHAASFRRHRHDFGSAVHDAEQIHRPVPDVRHDVDLPKLVDLLSDGSVALWEHHCVNHFNVVVHTAEVERYLLFFQQVFPISISLAGEPGER